jgi:hypothetical protein
MTTENLKTVIKPGDRVELHPATDRYGVVVAVGHKWINDLIPVLPGNLTVIGA